MKLALRSLLRTPGFTLVALLTLALGIGMNTAMFSLLNGFLLRPLAYPDSHRLFRLDRNSPQQPLDDHSASNFADITAASSSIAELAAFRFWAFTVTNDNQPPDVPIAARISPNFFDVLRVKPALGRTFRPDEDAVGKNDVVILSHVYWQSRFSGAPDIIGRTIRLDGMPVEVVGVMPPDEDMLRFLAPAAVFRPLALTKEESVHADNSIGVIGRYRDGVSPEQASAQFEAIGRRLAADRPVENAGTSLGIRSLQSTTLSGTGLNMTLVLIALSTFVLLIACANLANLLLARAISRVREFSIRAALGASRAQLIKPLVLECALLATGGGLAAILVSIWTTDWLGSRFTTPQYPIDFSPDGRVLGFAIAASLLTALLFGVAPAWWAARIKLNDSLKSSGRGATGTRSQNRFRQALIVTQFALALILLTGAGFFLHGLDRLIHARVGWNPDSVVSGVVNLASPTRFGSAEPIIAFHTQLRERLLTLPGVENASVSYEIPLFNAPSRHNLVVEGRAAPRPGEEIAAFINGVSPSFLDTVGLRLLRGRFIDETDQLTSRQVVVINETMAAALFPEVDPIGQRLALAGQQSPQWAEIVGVVADVRALQMRPSPVRFQVYKPFAQEAWQYVTIAVRVADPAKAPLLLDSIRQAVASLDSDTPVMRLMPVSQRIEQNFGVWTTINQLLIIFAALGLSLAALGIYGVVTRLVIQRTGEIGVRMALGAQVRDILGLVLRDGLRMTLAGAGVGIIGALFLVRLASKALPAFGNETVVPISAGVILLLAVAIMACLLPARRATRVNPITALRAD